MVDQKTVDNFDHRFGGVDILPFVETSYVVCLSYLALVEDDVNDTGMIYNIKSVAYVFVFAINWKRFLVTDVIDKDCNLLPWELIRAIFVRAVSDNVWHVGCIVISVQSGHSKPLKDCMASEGCTWLFGRRNLFRKPDVDFDHELDF